MSKADALAKAQRVKRAAMHKRIWGQVLAYREGNRCSCDIRPGMTHDELTPLGSGCQSRFVCPVLDAYRRFVDSAVKRPSGVKLDTGE